MLGHLEDLDELDGLCDGIVVLFRGAAWFGTPPAEDATSQVGMMMTREAVAE